MTRTLKLITAAALLLCAAYLFKCYPPSKLGVPITDTIGTPFPNHSRIGKSTGLFEITENCVCPVDSQDYEPYFIIWSSNGKVGYLGEVFIPAHHGDMGGWKLQNAD